MAVQGVFSVASDKADTMSPFRPHSSQDAFRGMGTAGHADDRRNSNEHDAYRGPNCMLGRRLSRCRRFPCPASRYPTDGGMDPSGSYHQRAPDSGGGEGGPAIRPQVAATGGSPAGPRPRASRIPAAQGKADG